MTSNLGARHFAQGKKLGFVSGGEAAREERERAVLAEARNTFAPEFLSRLDEILVFHPLEQKTLEAITRQLLDETGGRLEKLGVSLEVEEEAVALLAREGSGEQGARPLRRAVAARVEDPAADLLLSGALKKGGKLRVAAREGEVRVESGVKS